MNIVNKRSYTVPRSRIAAEMKLNEVYRDLARSGFMQENTLYPADESAIHVRVKLPKPEIRVPEVSASEQKKILYL